jgi:hypothetical protein
MGTSTSHPSPQTRAWRAVSASYRNKAQDAPAIAKIIWRASRLSGDLGMERLLAAPIVATCLNIAATSTTREIAAKRASRQIALSGQTGIGAELARRALVQSYAFEDRTEGFAKCIISEATNYFISRDLPSLLGSSTRFTSISDVASLKSEILQHVRGVVGESSPIPADARELHGFVAKVGQRLRGDN